MGGEGRAFSSHGLQVKRGRGCPAAAQNSPAPSKNSGSPVPGRCWTGMEMGPVGGGKVTLWPDVTVFVPSGWPQAPSTDQSQGPLDLGVVPGPVLGMLGAQPPDLGSGVLECSARCWAPSRAESALSSKCCPLFCLLAAEMLAGGHGPPQGAPARLVCVLGEWDVRLLSVSLLQRTSVLSVPPVPAMSGAWGWVWWVPAPLGVPCPQDPTLRAGGGWHSCVAAVLSGCLAVSLSARSDLSFSLFPPLPHCSHSPCTSSPPSSLLHLFPPLFFSISSFLSPLSSPSSSLCVLCAVSLSLSLSFPLVHGGKGIRFTLSEEVYPEKGTCATRPPLHLPAAGLGQ